MLQMNCAGLSVLLLCITSVGSPNWGFCTGFLLSPIGSPTSVGECSGELFSPRAPSLRSMPSARALQPSNHLLSDVLLSLGAVHRASTVLGYRQWASGWFLKETSTAAVGTSSNSSQPQPLRNENRTAINRLNHVTAEFNHIRPVVRLQSG